MAFLRCLQTVSSAGGRKVRANTDGPREVEKKEESEGGSVSRGTRALS